MKIEYRPIKFRVWNGTSKSWEHGPNDEVNLFGETILLGEFMRVKIEELNDCVPLQFTGALDKNGKEIYEGDIMYFPAYEEDKEKHLLVKYDTDHAAFCVGGFAIWKDYIEIATIVGNIFETPELLEKCQHPLLQ